WFPAAAGKGRNRVARRQEVHRAKWTSASRGFREGGGFSLRFPLVKRRSTGGSGREIQRKSPFRDIPASSVSNLHRVTRGILALRMQCRMMAARTRE